MIVFVFVFYRSESFLQLRKRAMLLYPTWLLIKPIILADTWILSRLKFIDENHRSCYAITRISTKTNIMKDENGRFIGFYSPRYTQVPDDLFDDLMSELSGSELKVLLYVIRRTFGFKKDSDLISLSQMVSGIVKKDGTILDKGTGLSKEGVSKALKSLVEKGILIKNRKHSEKRGFKASEYALSIFNYPLSDNLTSPPSQNNRQALAQKSDIQETVKQKTDITLSKPVDNSHSLQEKELLGQIMVTCRDLNSFNFYRKVIREVPKFKILSALSQVKEAQALGRIKKNAGAMFTDLVKRV